MAKPYTMTRITPYAFRVTLWGLFLFCLVAVVFHGHGVKAQEYPQRIITLSVATDIHPAMADVAELIAAQTQKLLEKTVIVQKISKTDTRKFLQGINSLQNQGYNLALVSYPQVVAYDLGLWQREARTNPFDWRDDLVPLASMAFDPLVLVTDPSVRTQPLRFMASLQTQKNPVRIAMVDDAVDQVNAVLELSMVLNLDIDRSPRPYALEAIAQTLTNKEASLAFVSLSRFYSDGEQDSSLELLRPMIVAGPVIHPQLPYTDTLKDLGIDKVFGQHYVLVMPTGVPNVAKKVLTSALKDIKKSSEYRAAIYSLGLFPSDQSATINSDAQKVLNAIVKARENTEE